MGTAQEVSRSDCVPRVAAGRLYNGHDRHGRRRHRRLRLGYQAAAKAAISSFADRNAHFDRLFAKRTRDYFGSGQNTNHLSMHPAVRKALIEAVDAEEFHAYAPPGGFIALINSIIADLGLPAETFTALVTEGAVAALATACRTLCTPGTNFVTTDPGWKWPIQFARQAGAEVREIPIYESCCRYRSPRAAA